MSLDLFASSIAAADQDVVANAARDLPAGFGETWDVSWRSLTEWHNSIGYNVARSRAMADYSDDIYQKTGERLPVLNGASGELQMLGIDSGSLDAFNAAQEKLKEKYPGLDYLKPLSDADVDAMARQRMARAHADAKSMNARETTWGGTAGTVAGTLAGAFADPIAIATLPLGGVGEAGVLLRGLEFAAIAGGTEAVTSLVAMPLREAAVPGSSREIPGDVLAATLGGGALGLAFGVFGKLLRRGADPLPTSVRDDLNAASAEAQANITNPFPTVAGSAAARDAVNDALSAVVRGEPVRVGENFDPMHVADYARSVRAASPEELAIAGEKHLRPETYGEVPNVERFDPMPSATDDVASYWERRLEQATPEERAALGATDFEPPAALNTDAPAVRAPDLSPAQMAGLEADPATGDAVWHNVEHIMQQNPEAEFTQATRLDDGSYRFDTFKLSDVMKELDDAERAARELEACAIGMGAAK